MFDSLSYFKIDKKLVFYLQKSLVKDWVDNSMLFLEVENLEAYFIEIKEKSLTEKYTTVKFSKIVQNNRGEDFYLHDSSVILWHFGNFKE